MPAALPGAPPAIRLDRIAVRLQQPPLTAVRAAHAQTVDLADGRRVPVAAGDWLIARGQAILDWSPAADLWRRYEPADAGLLVPTVVRQRLERVLGPGTSKTPETLTAAVERLAAISVGGVRIEFTPGQLEELQHRAQKRGQTLQQTIEAVVARIRDEIFWKG